MIRLFRKIRNQLLSEKRYSIYLLYASGEVILVMLGILLALQIDNWNDERKEGIEESAYLQRYRNDLVQDTAYLRSKIIETRMAMDSTMRFISLMPQKQNSVVDMIRLVHLPNWNADELILQDYTFQEVTNSGKFGLFKDIRIREGITDYYRTYEFFRSHISEMAGSGVTMLIEVMPHLSRYFNYESLSEYEIFPEHNWNWINKPSDIRYKQLEATAAHNKYKFDMSEVYFNMLLSKADALLKLIEDQ